MQFNGMDAIMLEVGKRYLHIDSGTKFNVLSFFSPQIGMPQVEIEYKDEYGDTRFLNSMVNTPQGIFAKAGAFKEITLEEW